MKKDRVMQVVGYVVVVLSFLAAVGVLVPWDNQTWCRAVTKKTFTYTFQPVTEKEAIAEAQARLLKKIFLIISYLPSTILEPILRWVHIRHTFKLPENHWVTSSTIANKQMLKLHALDPRKDLRAKFYEILNKYK